jgi:hypothetical protein
MKRFGLALVVFMCVLVFLSCVPSASRSNSQKKNLTAETPPPIVSIMPIIPTPSPTQTSAEEPAEPEPRYGFTEDEVYLLAQLLCGSGSKDGDGEYDIDFKTEINYCEVAKVLCVVMNRVRSDSFPNTVTDVVMQKGHFSVMPRNAQRIPSDIAIQTVQEWCEAYDRFDGGAQNISEDHLYFTGNGVTNTTRANY